MTMLMLCHHCNEWVRASDYYDHLFKEHGEDED